MAVMAVRGDLRHLACRAWYLPGDVHRVIAWTWTHDDPVLDAGLAELRQQPLPAGWGVDGVRVEAVPLADKTRATPVHCAIPSGGTNEWNYHRETLRQFVDLALDLPDPQGITRARPLLAVPLIGTGFSSYQPSFDKHLRGLLDALEGETRADFVIVVRGATEFAALQGTGGSAQAARRIELFLDALLLSATYLFDPRFAGLLTEQEAVLRDALVDTFRGKRMPESPAWARTQRLLADLGWRD